MLLDNCHNPGKANQLIRQLVDKGQCLVAVKVVMAVRLWLSTVPIDFVLSQLAVKQFTPANTGQSHTCTYKQNHTYTYWQNHTYTYKQNYTYTYDQNHTYTYKQNYTYIYNQSPMPCPVLPGPVNFGQYLF